MRCIELDGVPQDASILMLRACMQVPHLAEVLCGAVEDFEVGRASWEMQLGPG